MIHLLPTIFPISHQNFIHLSPAKCERQKPKGGTHQQTQTQISFSREKFYEKKKIDRSV